MKVRHLVLCASTYSTLPRARSIHHVSCVSGAARGIGKAFTNQLLLRNPDSRVYALMRDVNCKTAVDMKSKFGDRYLPVQMDLTEDASIEQTARYLQETLSGARVDLLLNVAGILGGREGDLGPERSMQGIDRAWLERTMQTNLIGHVMLSKAMIPFMKSRGKDGQSNPSKLVNLSARVGSISDNNLGGWYSYRMSKAALNMFTKTCSIETKRYNVLCMSIHPGTTDTDLSKPFQKNIKPETLLSVDDSVSQMLRVIDGTNDMNKSGSFFAYNGSEIGW